MKKLTSILLALCLCFGVSVTALAADKEPWENIEIEFVNSDDYSRAYEEVKLYDIYPWQSAELSYSGDFSYAKPYSQIKVTNGVPNSKMRIYIKEYNRIKEEYADYWTQYFENEDSKSITSYYTWYFDESYCIRPCLKNRYSLC